MSKAPVFGNPAVELTRDLQLRLDAINAAAPPGSGVVHPPGTVLYGQQLSLTPAQQAAQIPIQNATIQRLESAWATASLPRKRDIVKGIDDLLRGFPGTTSAHIADFKRQLGGRRHRKTRRTRRSQNLSRRKNK